MKVQILDNQNNPLIGWKHWAAIAAIVGSSASVGGVFPEQTPYHYIDKHLIAEACDTE